MKSKNKGFEYTCNTCGNKFRRAQKTQYDTVFCSQKCYGLFQRIAKDRECPTCGKIFRSTPSQDRTFCSWECYDRSRTNTVDKTCPVCKRIFTVKVSIAHRYTACSRTCGAIMRRTLSEEERKRHKGARAKVNDWVRDNRMAHPSTLKCTKCGRQAEQYHHHNGYAKENWLDVIPVCAKCHHEAHH